VLLHEMIAAYTHGPTATHYTVYKYITSLGCVLRDERTSSLEGGRCETCVRVVVDRKLGVRNTVVCKKAWDIGSGVDNGKNRSCSKQIYRASIDARPKNHSMRKITRALVCRLVVWIVHARTEHWCHPNKRVGYFVCNPAQ
jgi:hypothetical protein